MKKYIYCPLIVMLGISLMLCTVADVSADSEYKHKKAKDIVSLVNDAADLIEKEGTDIFPRLREKGSKWFNDDIYVFVWEITGLRVVYPPDIKGEGKNMIGLKDINGKPIGKMFVSMVSGDKKEAWCHYQWPKPGETCPLWKSTYLKRAKSPSGKEYVVGSGMYGVKTENKFVVDLVDDAVALIKQEGEAAFDILRTSDYMFKDIYVFVTREDGTELVNPAFPDLEGRNISNLKEYEGKYEVHDIFVLLKDKDAVWKEGMWPKPGTNKLSRNIAYIRKVVLNGDVLAVGAGFYPD